MYKYLYVTLYCSRREQSRKNYIKEKKDECKVSGMKVDKMESLTTWVNHFYEASYIGPLSVLPLYYIGHHSSCIVQLVSILPLYWKGPICNDFLYYIGLLSCICA